MTLAPQVIKPPRIVQLEGPTVFLAGPIQGVADWQMTATLTLRQLDYYVNIANPRRQYLDGDFVYEQQVDWETHFLRKAGQLGVVLFWLASEEDHDCERSFAQTSRFELAEWKLRHERDGVKLVIGISDGFSGSRYIQRRCAQDCSDVPILNSLEDCCRVAIDLVRN